MDSDTREKLLDLINRLDRTANPPKRHGIVSPRLRLFSQRKRHSKDARSHAKMASVYPTSRTRLSLGHTGNPVSYSCRGAPGFPHVLRRFRGETLLTFCFFASLYSMILSGVSRYGVQSR